MKNGEIVDADNVYVNDKAVTSENVHEGDIIVVVRNGSRALIGKHAQIKASMPNTVIGAFMSGMRSEHSSFVNALLDTSAFENEIAKNMGATINQITGYMFSKMEFMIPSGDEQQKIGEHFQSLDNLITLHHHKLFIINSKQEQTLSEHIEFSELEILQLSEFYEITAKAGEDIIRRIIMIPTSDFPDDRESAAVNSVVKDRPSFVEYIAFVLGDDYIASMLEGKQMGESGFFCNSSDAMPALYEKMLKTSVEEPERIKDIGYILKMVTDNEIIPDEFRELYETFCNTLKIRR